MCILHELASLIMVFSKNFDTKTQCMTAYKEADLAVLSEFVFAESMQVP